MEHRGLISRTMTSLSSMNMFNCTLEMLILTYFVTLNHM